jgi:hypothetical protein
MSDPWLDCMDCIAILAKGERISCDKHRPKEAMPVIHFSRTESGGEIRCACGATWPCDDARRPAGYMALIDTVAESCFGQLDQNLGRRILDLWSTIDKLAGELPKPYDIFRPSPLLRSTMKALIHVLYELPVANPVADCDQLRRKNAEYGGSWAKRGGTGAFHAIVRKADRLETQLKKWNFDLARAFESEHGLTESLEDTLGDLRRYLILVEAWLLEKQADEEFVGRQP